MTLRYAVTGNDETELMEHILKADLEPIEHHFHRKIDRRLQAIIRKATAYEIGERYQTADALADDLRRYMAGLPVSAKPDHLRDRILRYFFEHIWKF